jgi:hypothetical protein
MGITTGIFLSVVQAVTRPDTLIARVIPVRGVLDWSSGVLQLVVLVLGVATLVTMVMLLLTVRQGVTRLNSVLEQFAADTKPLIGKATEVVSDAREVVAMLRTDVERVTDAAGEISEQLLAAADATARRVDDVNAVLDVLQEELEDTAIATVAAVRGVRVGARTVAAAKQRRPNRDDPASA